MTRRSFILHSGGALGAAGAALGASTPDSAYFRTVSRAADTLLASGRDDIGPRRTAMFFSVLDRKTSRPPETLPPAPDGVRDSDRTNAWGANVNLQQNLFLMLRRLSRITGDKAYQRAADAAMLDLFRLGQSPKTGLLPWGEHMFWDCLRDEPGTEYRQPIHEPKRKLLFFDELYAAEQKRVIAYARGIWDHQIFDHATGNFSRHARYDEHGPGKDADFLKEAGYFIDLWSRVYEKTKDSFYLNAIRTIANRYLSRMNERNLLDFDSSTDPERENNCLTNDNLALAIEALPAAARVDAPTRALLLELSQRLDAGFLALPHEPDDAGFHYSLYTDSGKLRPRKGDDGHSRHWALGYGVKSTSLFGVFCHTRFQQLSGKPEASRYRDLFLRAADLYRKTPPDSHKDDIWAGEYGMAIFLELAAFRSTRKTEYLEAARALADDAMRVFWDQDSALPRASTQTAHYESVTYTDTLMLSLLAVDEEAAGRKASIPINDLDR